MNKKIFIFFIVGMLLIINFNFISIATNTKSSNISLYNINIIESNDLSDSKTIKIDGDNSFTFENGVINPEASGLENDEYIISLNECKSLIISDTTKHFVIKDSILKGEKFGILFSNVKNGEVKNCQFLNEENGINIVIIESENCEINNCNSNNVNNNDNFFSLFYKSNNNYVHNCNIGNNNKNCDYSGLFFINSNYNTICDCIISKCEIGLAFEDSNDNRIYYNDFLDNYVNVDARSGVNQWDDGNCKGNYWDDYQGEDADEDGIGDSFYVINDENKDRYPIVNSDNYKNNVKNLVKNNGFISYFIDFFKENKILISLKNFISFLKNKYFFEFGDKDNCDFLTSDLHDGWLEERDGVKILHLKGSYYDMGFQHGELLSSLIGENLRAQLSYFEDHGWPYSKILDKYYEMDDNLPDEYKDEILGMADGSGMSFEDIAVLNTIPAIFNHAAAGSCCEVSLWGPKTLNGDMYHIRGWDWRLDLKDPETGRPFQETQIVIVRDPENAYASLYPEFAGHIFAWAGFNEKGVAIGETTCRTNDYTFEGISGAFRMRMVLDYASNGDEAINIMTNNRTCGWNFVISDSNNLEATAIEETANICYVGKWDDPIEDSGPFWIEQGLVRRVPFFIHPETAETQPGRVSYDPSGILGLIKYFTGVDRSFSVWYFYKTISDAVINRQGSLDLERTMSMIRDVYLGKTDLLFYIIMKIGLVHSIHQWVANPNNGDFTIAFANEDTFAFKNPVHTYNLYDLLDDQP